jgi:hypothetical protein
MRQRKKRAAAKNLDDLAAHHSITSSARALNVRFARKRTSIRVLAMSQKCQLGDIAGRSLHDIVHGKGGDGSD